MHVLVMTAAFGTGHNQVAGALAEASTEAGHTVGVIDTFAAGAPLVGKCLTGGFIQLLHAAPGLYRSAYLRTEVPGQSDRLRRLSMEALTQLLWPRLKPLLAGARPDVVLATHPFVLGVLANLRQKGRLQAGLAGVLTDFAPHAMWVHPGVDAYYVATADMAATMTSQGIDGRRVQVTGIPIRQVFSGAPARAAAALDLGLDPARPTVLLMGGGLGLGPMGEMVAAARTAGLPLQILAVTGHNRRLYEQLRAGAPEALRVYGYVPYVHRLMAASDLLVSKPGAVTAAEALALGLPMLLVEPIPGQEERNQAALVARGAARVVPSPGALAAALRQLLSDPEDLAAMRRAAYRAGEPGAARQVIQHVSGLGRQARAWSA